MLNQEGQRAEDGPILGREAFPRRACQKVGRCRLQALGKLPGHSPPCGGQLGNKRERCHIVNRLDMGESGLERVLAGRSSNWTMK